MPTINLPEKPNIEHLKKQAKLLRSSCAAGDAHAVDLAREFHPEGMSLDDSAMSSLSLSDAQLIVARHYGFASWPRLKDAVSRRHRNPLRVQLDDAIRSENLSDIDDIIRARPELLHEVLWHVNWGPPLPHAAQLGKMESVKRLIDLGADEYEAAFGRASMMGFLEIATYLYHKAPGILLDLSGACEALNESGIRFLIGLGADPNAAIGSDYPLDLAIKTYAPGGDRQACINALIEGGVTHVDGPVFDILAGRTRQLEARLKHDSSLVCAHFDLSEGRRHGGPPWMDVYGGFYGGAPLKDSTLLHYCAEYGALEEARGLLEYGADVNGRAKPDERGVGDQTPIYHAVASAGNNSYEVLDLLITRGADVNTTATLQVPHRAYYDDAQPHPLFRDITPLGYVHSYPQSYCAGPGSGDDKGIDNKPHENVVRLLKQHSAQR